MEPKENAPGASRYKAFKPVQSIRNGLMILGGLLVVVGFAYVGAGIMGSRCWLKARGIKTVVKADHNTNGTIVYATGSLCAFVGICGIVTAMLKKLEIRLAFMGLLALALAANIGFIVWSGVQAHRTLKETKDRMHTEITTAYGSGSSNDSKRVDATTNFDHIHITTPCCGWSGNDGDNLYTQSPWYQRINLNRAGKERTLPDSCCITATEDCRSAKNLKDARSKGFVHKWDCLYTAKFYYKATILVEIVLLAGGCFIQIVFLSWLVMERINEVVSPSSRGAARKN